jgi:TPR repeat protein
MANNGDGNAANSIGNFYKRGFQQPNSNFSPVPIDLNEARRWFELAIKNNSVFGYFNMGVFYEEGLGGVNKDLNKAGANKE